MNKKRSTNIEIQQFFSLQITLQTLSDTNRTYTHRSPSKEQVTNFQSYKLAYISDYIIYLEKHICRTTALHFLTVDQQMKVKILNILIVLHRNKSSNSSRRIKTFAKLPRKYSFPVRCSSCGKGAVLFSVRSFIILGNGPVQVGVKEDDWEKRHFALFRPGNS